MHVTVVMVLKMATKSSEFLRIDLVSRLFQLFIFSKFTVRSRFIPYDPSCWSRDLRATRQEKENEGGGTEEIEADRDRQIDRDKDRENMNGRKRKGERDTRKVGHCSSR